ncbi:hypothetical protein GUITHDRAFT_106696 [Guillardia theta CCMP2712]|uniref:PABS domain-containing protein n=1 Tax=Guillardia theta (strain CCMP2712) TaxID=905079 RepID=L1JHT8_GUITC|nr:hypothetical protein GUITHDRAFT_106696 [Guillardia theta CCMP2712]EKX47709.1 hypothetical protein GUITHDRAFT_106696 [Guillardia theta CCMP2712]|eukprot:XP_005834689.1 hypothetical protein GUITHDRAFT_106696 [Guillardia theta CCMP2712]
MGGGMIPAYLQHQFPSASIDIVDLEKDIFPIAFTWFNVVERPSTRTFVADGRRWLNDYKEAQGRYDVVVQDACAGHPCSMLTVEGLTIIRERVLAEHGVIVQNLFGSQVNVLRTYQEVFPSVVLVDTGFSSKIIVSSSEHLPTRQAFLDRSRLLQFMERGPLYEELL